VPEEKEQTTQQIRSKTYFTRVPPRGGIVMTNTWDESDDEMLVDVEDLSTPLFLPTEPRTDQHNSNSYIGFRVWDDDSRTKFSEETGFVSEAFTIWRG
jgi:hypothetical protein